LLSERNITLIVSKFTFTIRKEGRLSQSELLQKSLKQHRSFLVRMMSTRVNRALGRL
jgi:hypothetical protein